LFNANTAAAGGAIYLAGTDNSTNSASVYFNAGNSGVITVNDSIAGSASANNNIYVNSNNATASTSIITPANTLTDGRVNLNGDITGTTVTVAGSGNTYFGQSGSVATGYYSGSTINLNSSATNYFYNGVSGATIAASTGTTNFNSVIAGSTITASGGTQNFSASAAQH